MEQNKTQGEKISSIETSVEFIKDGVKEIKDSLFIISNNQQAFATKEDLKELGKTKAGKWTEVLTTSIALAVISAIIILVIKNINF